MWLDSSLFSVSSRAGVLVLLKSLIGEDPFHYQTGIQTPGPIGIWLSVLDQFCFPRCIFHLVAKDGLEEG